MFSRVNRRGVFILGVVLLALIGLEIPAWAEGQQIRVQQIRVQQIRVHRMGEPDGQHIRVLRMGEPG